MRAASGVYEVLINVDSNIPYQHNIAGLHIAILVLAAKRNSYVRLTPLIPKALKVLEIIKVPATLFGLKSKCDSDGRRFVAPQR